MPPSSRSLLPVPVCSGFVIVDYIRVLFAQCQVYYPFFIRSEGRVHQTLRVTPAMEAGVTDHVWTLGELVGLLDTPESVAA